MKRSGRLWKVASDIRFNEANIAPLSICANHNRKLPRHPETKLNKLLTRCYQAAFSRLEAPPDDAVEEVFTFLMELQNALIVSAGHN